jgi:hypothetical protein
MEMQVPAVLVCVEVGQNTAVTPLMFNGLGQLPDHTKHSQHDVVIAFAMIGERRNVLFGNHDNMQRPARFVW